MCFPGVYLGPSTSPPRSKQDGADGKVKPDQNDNTQYTKEVIIIKQNKQWLTVSLTIYISVLPYFTLIYLCDYGNPWL